MMTDGSVTLWNVRQLCMCHIAEKIVTYYSSRANWQGTRQGAHNLSRFDILWLLQPSMKKSPIHDSTDYAVRFCKILIVFVSNVHGRPSTCLITEIALLV